MNKKDVIEQLLKHFAYGNQSQFARLLGCQQGVVAGWIRRNSIDPERIKRAFPQVDGNWLLTGEGNMLLEDKNITKAVLTTHQNTNNGTQIIGESVDNRNSETDMLKQRIVDLQALLNEKERLIKVLLDNNKGGI